MKKLLSILTISFVVVLLSGKCFAQQWSSEQKEVWSAELKMWDAFNTGKPENFMPYYDDSYMGWNLQSIVPQSKDNASRWWANFNKNNSVVLTTLTPFTIWVKGDFAYVHYFYSELDKNNVTGKEDRTDGSWTDILIKKDGKWILIGDHEGRVPQKQQPLQ
jgi:ketosteroid isomerase-like protein